MLPRFLRPSKATFHSFVKRGLSLQNFFESSPVLISSNKDIYTNLALEHLLYNKLRFAEGPRAQLDAGQRPLKRPVVLIWTDEPCVVIGRHQNPWLETNVGVIHKAGMKLARRHSGGGCVFHDENNINISIINHRGAFEDRTSNLQFLADFLHTHYKIKCEPTKRFDLIHSETGHKLTGSAAKLGQHNCYHHFTLLVNSDKEALYTSIRQKQQDFIQTNSTTSTRSKVINLKEIDSSLDIDQVVTDLAIAYGKHYNVKETTDSAKKSRVEINESEKVDLVKYKDELASWDWIYAKTPKFTLERTLPVIDQGSEKEIKFKVRVNKGVIEHIDIDGLLGRNNLVEPFKSLLGLKFTYNETMVGVSKLLQDENVGNCVGLDKVLGMFLLQMVHQAHF